MDLFAFDSYTFFPGQHWGHTWERQHELVSRFASLLDNKELNICSPTGLLNHNPFTLDFIKRVLKYNKAQSDINEEKANPVLDNMRMVNPTHLPFHNKFVGRINYALMSQKLNMSNNNFFWSTYMNPTVYEFFRRSKFKVYDLAERRSHNPLLPDSVKELERIAVKEADIVFIDNHITMKDYEGLNNNMYYVPQGVNIDTFFPLDDNREYIGYIGNLHFAIDYDYMEKLFQCNPNEKFLLIGGILEDRAHDLLKPNNITHMNQIPKSDLNKYLAKMKVGLIPYVNNDVTVGVYPTKLFEYLAANVPVISTSIPEVLQYQNDSYLKIIDCPCALTDVTFDMKGIKEVIANNTWDERWNLYINRITKC